MLVNDFVRPESMEVPDGGLASFLTATVGEWADDDVPHNGIAGLHNVADKLAEYGRYEDTYMVHAAEGETVIPMAVFDENPRLKESLFNQMRAMGIDPERYVVGSELNSINPVTGQPEFFLKKLFKGLKKAVKKVIKVVKKVAPVALSIGLSFVPGIGPILGSTLGSGIGTLIQGGDLKDALKMGAIGGLTAGLFKGIQGGFRGMKAGQGFGTGFGAGVRSGLPGATPYTPTAAATQPTAGVPATNTVSTMSAGPAPQGGINPDALARSGTGIVGPNHPYSMLQRGVNPSLYGGPSGALTPPDYLTTSSATVMPQGTSLPVPGNINMDALARSGTGVPGPNADFSFNAAPRVSAASPLPNDMGSFYEQNPVHGTTPPDASAGAGVTPDASAGAGVPPVPEIPEITATALEQAQRPSTWESVKDMFVDTGSGKNFFGAAKDVFFPRATTAHDIVAAQLGIPQATLEEVVKKAGSEAAYNTMIENATTKLAQQMLINPASYKPGFLRKYGPLAAGGAGILGLTGGYEQPEMEEAVDPFDLGGQSSWDLLAANPQKYRVFAGGAPYNLTASPYGAAQGGYTSDFPRRDGAISGPGTGTSDDIPAMLSDGEFVMTERAVRGAGNGDRGRGVRKMYEIMRTYEGVA